MENLIIYSIIFFIILIGLILLYISLNPVEIKEKPLEVKKDEKFIGTTIEESIRYDITTSSIQGIENTDYILRNFNDDKLIIIKRNCSIQITREIPNCKILIVAGGGGGGGNISGGGGGGQVLFNSDYNIPIGTINIIVGSGGEGGLANQSTAYNGYNGNNSSISFNTNTFIAIGGGGGGSRRYDNGGIAGANGGSGGGGSHSDRAANNSGGLSNKNIYSGWNSYGNNGGFGKQDYQSGYGSGGGGGAGSSGGNAVRNISGNGGAGINMTEYFGNIVGNAGWFGGGGGGGSYGGGINGFGNGGNNLLGGGGNAYSQNGLENTGGGGGGANFVGKGGNGGSGVVIIRYRPVVVQPDPSQGRVASTVDLNTISDPDADRFKTMRTEPINDASFGTVSTPIDRTAGGFIQRATTFSLYPELIPIINFDVYYSSYDTTMTSGNFMPTPTFLFGSPSFDPAVTYTSSYFRPRRYTPTTGEFIDTTNALDINIIDREITYNNITLLDSNNQRTTNLQTIRGEYVGIKCPRSFNLIAYSFTANLAFENLAPGAWVVLGRNSSITESRQTYKLISQSPKVNNDFERQQWSIYQNNAQTKRCYVLGNTDTFDEYLFIFPKLAQTDIRANVNYGHQLIFKEIKLFSVVPDGIER